MIEPILIALNYPSEKISNFTLFNCFYGIFEERLKQGRVFSEGATFSISGVEEQPNTDFCTKLENIVQNSRKLNLYVRVCSLEQEKYRNIAFGD